MMTSHMLSGIPETPSPKAPRPSATLRVCHDQVQAWISHLATHEAHVPSLCCGHQPALWGSTERRSEEEETGAHTTPQDSPGG